MTGDDCPPVLGVEVVLNGAVTDCAARKTRRTFLAQYQVRQVILAGAWFQYPGDYDKVLLLLGGADASLHSTTVLSRQLNQTIRSLQDAGIEVVIVGPEPFVGWNVPSVLAASAWRGMAPPDGPRLGDFMTHTSPNHAAQQIVVALKHLIGRPILP